MATNYNNINHNKPIGIGGKALIQIEDGYKPQDETRDVNMNERGSSPEHRDTTDQQQQRDEYIYSRNDSDLGIEAYAQSSMAIQQATIGLIDRYELGTTPYKHTGSISHLRHSLAANALPMDGDGVHNHNEHHGEEELIDTNASFDIMNSNSFNFDLLNTEGSLSFENDGTTGVGGGNNTKLLGGERKESLDLTSAVTASLDQMNSIYGGTTHHNQHGGGGGDFAFGNPNDPLYGNNESEVLEALVSSVEQQQAAETKKKRGRGRPRKNPSNPRKSSGAGTTKKRKPVAQDPSSLLNGHESPPALPPCESAPASTLEMMNMIHDPYDTALYASLSASPVMPSNGQHIFKKKPMPSMLNMPDVIHHGEPTSNNNSNLLGGFNLLSPSGGIPGVATWDSSAAGGASNLPPLPGQVEGGISLPQEVYLGGNTHQPDYMSSSSAQGNFPLYTYPPPPAVHNTRGSKSDKPKRKKKETRKKKESKYLSGGPSVEVPIIQKGKLGEGGINLLRLPDGTLMTRDQAPGIGWTPEEDIELLDVMSTYKRGQDFDWHELAKKLTNTLTGEARNARECHDRWTRYLKPGSRKGQWTEEEDSIVLRVIFDNRSGVGYEQANEMSGKNKDGSNRKRGGSRGGRESIMTFTQWADLAPQLPGRTGKQIRDRWVNYLNPSINHLPFSREDDIKLWEGHAELGKRWVEVSCKVFNSERSENHIKNRWYSAAFKRFVQKEYGPGAYDQAKQSGFPKQSSTSRYAV